MVRVNMIPTKEREHVIMRKRVTFIPTQIVFKMDVNVLLVDGQPMVPMKDTNPASLTYGMTEMLDVEACIQRGYETAQPLGVTGG